MSFLVLLGALAFASTVALVAVGIHLLVSRGWADEQLEVDDERATERRLRPLGNVDVIDKDEL